MHKLLTLLALVAALGFGVVACEPAEEPATTPNEGEVDKAAEEMEEAGSEAKEAAEEAGSAAKEAMEDATE